MSDKKSQAVLDEIENITIGHYEVGAKSFWEGTYTHDVSQNINALLQALPKNKSLKILDFGCGPGRDLLTFKKLGHQPTGLDGCEAFCNMAIQHSGCQVLHQQFLSLDLVASQFDGIFANASLFHVPSQELHRVLTDCYNTLKPGGIMFQSNPRGNAEGWQKDRYGVYMEIEEMKDFLQQAGFSILEHYYRPEGVPKNQQPWLAIVSKAV